MPRGRATKPQNGAQMVERFWARVDTSGECWTWTGCTANGYGQLSFSGHMWPAHRLSYTLTNGPIPAGLFVCHHCDNPPCVRPDHLFLGTNADNVADMMAKGRHLVPRSLRATCCRGHTFTGENLIHDSKGYRVCRTCRLAMDRVKKRNKRARLRRAA